MKKNVAFLLMGALLITMNSVMTTSAEEENDCLYEWYGEGSEYESESGNAEDVEDDSENTRDLSLWTGTRETVTVEKDEETELVAALFDENGLIIENAEEYGVIYQWYRYDDGEEGETAIEIEGADTDHLTLQIDAEMARCDHAYRIECVAVIEEYEIISTFDLKADHVPVIDPEIPATGSSTGLREGSHCEVCGEILQEQEIIEKIVADTVVMQNAYNRADSVDISWEPSEKAEGYRLYRRENGGNWKKVEDLDTSQTSYNDKNVISNYTYFYTVRCITADGSALMSDYDRIGAGTLFVKAPKILAASNIANGVKITYEAVSGGEKYRIYRKTADTSWKGIGLTAEQSFIDTNAESGIDYTYTVRAANGAGAIVSNYDPNGISILALAKPVMKQVTAENEGACLSWKPVNGATKYRIYRRSNISDSWTILADVTEPKYIDTTVKNNTVYYYTLRAFGGGVTSAYDTRGTGILFISTPKLKAADNAEKGISVTWSAVPGADLYRVFRKTADTGWVKVGDTGRTALTDTKAESGTEYCYTVRCMNSAGKYLSSYDKTGLFCLRIGNGELVSLSCSNQGIRLYWNKIAGAERYEIVRSDGGASYKTIARITNPQILNYLDTEAKTNGMKYRYAVRAFVGIKKGTCTPQTTFYLKTPTISGGKNTAAGTLTIMWNKNAAATGYQLSYITGSTEKRMAVNGNTNVKAEIMGLKKGSEYTVKIRNCYRLNGVNYWSGWSEGYTVKITK